MSEPLHLLILLAALYVYECAQWAPLGAAGFRAWWPRRWRQVSPWRAGPGWRRGALLGLPWPPLLPPLVCEPLPLQLGPRGLSIKRSGGELCFITWEQVGEVAVRERELLLGGELVARLTTRRLTLLLARALRELADLEPVARPARLRAMLEARWDDEPCRPRLRAFLRRSLPLLACQNLLWLSVFVGLPLLVWTPLTVYWPQVALTALAAWLACGVLFRLTLGRLDWLEREAWPDGMHRFLALASPISSMRSSDLLARELLGDLEPLAVAAALLPADRFGELARSALLDLEDRQAASTAAGEPSAAEDTAWVAVELRGRIERLLSRRGLSAEKLLAPPRPEDDRVRAWCPRCRGQYLRGERCPAAGCGGRELVPFARAAHQDQGVD